MNWRASSAPKETSPQRYGISKRLRTKTRSGCSRMLNWRRSTIVCNGRAMERGKRRLSIGCERRSETVEDTLGSSAHGFLHRKHAIPIQLPEHLDDTRRPMNFHELGALLCAQAKMYRAVARGCISYAAGHMIVLRTCFRNDFHHCADSIAIT